MDAKFNISVVIICKNEEKNLARALESVVKLAHEIILIDSFSTDASQEIAEKYGARFIQKEWMGYAGSKNYGNKLASGDLILSLDADECLSDELYASIAAISNPNSAYSFNRRNIYAGQFIKYCGWYPDRKLRLFPKGKAHWQGDFVHENLKLDPGIEQSLLSGDLLHYSYSSKEEHIAREKKYARLAAERDQERLNSWLMAYIKAAAKFLHMYILKLGVLDGSAGLQICLISAKGKLWKHQYIREINASDRP